MPTKYASGKHSIAECDICGFRYKLKELRKLTIKTKQVSIKVCVECWNPDHPQLQLGMYPVSDAQAVREPRPDLSYFQSGLMANGSIGEGSRDTQWGWNPVGFGNGGDKGLAINNLAAAGAVGTVTIQIS